MRQGTHDWIRHQIFFSFEISVASIGIICVQLQTSMNTTSVVCAVGVSLNPIFAICLNFQQQNPLKNQ
jgi:hypothetical protein